MVMNNTQALEQGEKTLAYRIRLYQLGCQEKILEKIESYGDQLVDFAIEQNREIQQMKKTMKQAARK